MSRIAERGLDYTYLDVNILNDRKIRRLKRRAGKAAPYIYISLLTAIFKEGYYIKWDEDAILDVADATGYEEDFIKDTVLACIEVGLFSKQMYEENNILTSSGIQKQFNLVCQKSKRKSKVQEFSLLIPSEEMPIPSEEKGLNSEEMQQRKVKKSKEDSFSSYSSPSSEVDSSEDEKQEEKYLSFMFFKNWASPNKEYQKFIAFNNTGGRSWAKMDETQREAALILWKQEPEKPKRFGETHLEFWKRIYEHMQTLHAPHEVLMHALSDNIEFDEKHDMAVIFCSEDVKEFIERNLDAGFGTIIHKFLLRPLSICKFGYQVCPP